MDVNAFRMMSLVIENQVGQFIDIMPGTGSRNRIGHRYYFFKLHQRIITDGDKSLEKPFILVSKCSSIDFIASFHKAFPRTTGITKNMELLQIHIFQSGAVIQYPFAASSTAYSFLKYIRRAASSPAGSGIPATIPSAGYRGNRKSHCR